MTQRGKRRNKKPGGGGGEQRFIWCLLNGVFIIQIFAFASPDDISTSTSTASTTSANNFSVYITASGESRSIESVASRDELPQMSSILCEASSRDIESKNKRSKKIITETKRKANDSASGTSETKQQTRQRSRINELIATIMRRTFALNHFVRTFVYLILRFSLSFSARAALGARQLFRIFVCLSALAFSVFDMCAASFGDRSQAPPTS